MWQPSGGEWRLFRNPMRILTANEPGEVRDCLRELQTAADEGLHAAGFLAYEAAPGLDKACKTHTPRDMPLLWFGLFKSGEKLRMSAPSECGRFNVSKWEPAICAREYDAAIGRIKDYLKSGDTYQVNYTLPLRARFDGDPWDFFCRLCRTQRSKYCAFVETECFALCSASPELFFSLDGATLLSRPMKGTSKRGLTFEQDLNLADALRHSEKNRAENIMIVDMVRNDMGRIADRGSVRVESLFDIERYPTVLQMTSTVACETSASLTDIMEALFPCASVTGAPKIRTMEIIKELEKEPRGVYTGCVGWVSPNRRAEFNVAIRTVSLDKQRSIATYGVGGGIVWDSVAEQEFEECRIKAAVLSSEARDFELLESLLWEKNKGYFLLDQHLERLERSAAYFGFAVDLSAVRRRLLEDAARMKEDRYKVRLRVGEEGDASVDWEVISQATQRERRRVTLAREPIDPENPFLYHKTTDRAVYERAWRLTPDRDDVLLWNPRGEVTESSIANVVIEKAGKRLTPPVSCGLLPGVFRAWLLERGEIEEGVVSLEDARNAQKMFLINSVRKWIPVALEP